MPDIEIYTSGFCAYCVAAKNLLKAKGLSWRETRVDLDPGARTTMLERSAGQRTVPQIFVNGTHLGGFQELALADSDGTLAKLLGGAA